MSIKTNERWISIVALTLLFSIIFSGLMACGSIQNANETTTNSEITEKSESNENADKTKNTQSTENAEATSGTSNSDDKDSSFFPIELEDGNILIQSIFPSDVENPDCDSVYTDQLASLEFTNQSDEYLASLRITVRTQDASLVFVAEDVVPDAHVWAFETSNQSIGDDLSIEDISCEVVYGSKESSVMNLLSVETKELEILVTNTSDQDLSNLQIISHSVMDDCYFGGKANIYTLEQLSSGGTSSIDASDCILGVDVVDVISNK